MGASQSQPTTSKASCSRRYSSHAEIETLFKTEIKSIIQKELSINSENPMDVVHNICAKLSASEFKDTIMKKCSFSTNVLVQEKPIEQLAQITESKKEDKLEHSHQVEEPEPHPKQVHHEQTIQPEQDAPHTEQVHQEQTIQLETSIQPEQAEPLLQLEQAEQHESPSKPVQQEQEQTEPLVQLDQTEQSVQQETYIQADQPEQTEQIIQQESVEPLIQLE